MLSLKLQHLGLAANISRSDALETSLLGADIAARLMLQVEAAALGNDDEPDQAPITVAASSGSIIVVHPSVPVTTVKELIAFARTRPGQMNYASAGTGTYPHMTMELFLSMAKLKMVHIAYKGTGPAMIDMLAGHTAVMAGTMVTTVPQIRAGRLRGLGITTTERNNAAPEIPTVAEAGLPGFESVQWYGLLAPANTPRDIVNRLHGEMVKILQQPEIRQRPEDP